MNKELVISDNLKEAFEILSSEKDSTIFIQSLKIDVLREERNRLKTERETATQKAEQEEKSAKKWRKSFLYASGIAVVEFIYILFR